MEFGKWNNKQNRLSHATGECAPFNLAKEVVEEGSLVPSMRETGPEGQYTVSHKNTS